MLKNDTWIKSHIGDVIEGGELGFKSRGVLSFGVSSFGYDVTLAPELKIMRNTGVIDPKAAVGAQWDNLEPAWDNVFVIPPHSFVLGYSKEYFKLPRNITGLVFPKSTYARCGLTCCQTVLEAGWQGQITLEFANSTCAPVLMYANEGCAQVLFYEGEPPCTSYADRCGKYQNQTGITLARVN